MRATLVSIALIIIVVLWAAEAVPRNVCSLSCAVKIIVHWSSTQHFLFPFWARNERDRDDSGPRSAGKRRTKTNQRRRSVTRERGSENGKRGTGMLTHDDNLHKQDRDI